MSISMETSSEITTKENPKVTTEKIENTDVILPEEIITDVVSRLPVKPVFQLQCLSKNFSSITSDLSFINAHLGHSARLRPSIILSKGQEIHLIRSNRLDLEITVKKVPLRKSINLTDPNMLIRIECSCNGLVVFSLSTPHVEPDCFVWNPAMIQCNRLPKPNNNEYGSFTTFAWGFGLCTETRQYKIVRLAVYCYSKVIAEILSCGIDSEWRRLDFSKFELFCNGPAITIRELVYWNTMSEQYDKKLLTFDLVKEEFAWILCPFSGCGKIMEFRGSLAVCIQSEINKNAFDLWVLKDVNENSWDKIDTITVENFPCMPLGFLNDHQLLLADQGKHFRGDYSCFLYDLEGQKIKRIPRVLINSNSPLTGRSPDMIFPSNVSGVVSYVESMVPTSFVTLGH